MGSWRDIDALLRERGVRIGAPTTGQTIGGSHASGSFHYAGLARDYGGSNSDLPAVIGVLRPLATGDGAPLVELFGPGVQLKRGRPIASPEIERTHRRHVHAAIRSNATLTDLRRGAGSGGAAFGITAGGGAAPSGSDGASPGAAANVIKLAGRITNPETWRRLGLVAAAAVLINIGVLILARDLIPTGALT